MRSVKEIVLDLCEKRGVKVGTLERETKMANGTIKKWTDESIPSGSTLVTIANYFGVTVDYILGRETESPDSYADIRRELDALRRDPNLRVLMSASEDLSEDDLRIVLALVKRMKGE